MNKLKVVINRDLGFVPKWAAMDGTGEVYVFEDKPKWNINEKAWYPESDTWADGVSNFTVLKVGLKPEESLTFIGKSELGNTVEELEEAIRVGKEAQKKLKSLQKAITIQNEIVDKYGDQLSNLGVTIIFDMGE